MADLGISKGGSDITTPCALACAVYDLRGYHMTATRKGEVPRNPWNLPRFAADYVFHFKCSVSKISIKSKWKTNHTKQVKHAFSCIRASHGTPLFDLAKVHWVGSVIFLIHIH